MPFALVIIGAVFIVAAIQGTEATLGTLLYNDFTGSKSFIWWALAILAIGSIGYVQPLKKFSDVFLALILISLLLAQGTGLYAQFQSAVSQATTSPETLPGAPQTGPPAAGTQSASSGGLFGTGITPVGAATAAFMIG